MSMDQWLGLKWECVPYAVSDHSPPPSPAKLFHFLVHRILVCANFCQPFLKATCASKEHIDT